MAWRRFECPEAIAVDMKLKNANQTVERSGVQPVRLIAPSSGRFGHSRIAARSPGRSKRWAHGDWYKIMGTESFCRTGFCPGCSLGVRRQGHRLAQGDEPGFGRALGSVDLGFRVAAGDPGPPPPAATTNSNQTIHPMSGPSVSLELERYWDAAHG